MGAIMREIRKSIDIIKYTINNLQGKELGFVVNNGRNKLENFDGKIVDIYPSIFTILPSEPRGELVSFSYNDVITKNIRIFGKPFKS